MSKGGAKRAAQQAQAAANRSEVERQNRITNATSAINGVFSNRDGLYKGLRDNVFSLNRTAVDRQAKDAQRESEFSMARTGLLGSSVNANANAELGRVTNEGLLKAGGVADQAVADLRGSDERTRNSLIGMAQSGIDTGTAQRSALEGAKANEAQTAASRSTASIGGLFDGFANAYIAKQQLAGGSGGSPFGGLFGNGMFGGPISPRNSFSGNRIG